MFIFSLSLSSNTSLVGKKEFTWMAERFILTIVSKLFYRHTGIAGKGMGGTGNHSNIIVKGLSFYSLSRQPGVMWRE